MKAIIYAAKSTEDKRGSIPTQIEDCEALSLREGVTVAGRYSDEAASGWSGNRGPELERAMEHASRIAPSWLVVQHTDRLARGDGINSRHLIELILWGMKSEVTIRSVQDDASGENLIMAAVMGERNNEDSKRKSAAVKAGMKRRREAGKHHGGPRPYGYDYDRLQGLLIVVEAEALIVRRIFEEYLAGASQLSITKRLRADCIPTIRGGKWHQGTVRTILANPVYAGRIGDARGHHQAIVDEVTWSKVEQLREANSRTSGRGRPAAGQHLFRKGMLRCHCGEAMVPRTNGEYQVYRCYGRHQDPTSCDQAPIRREPIDTAVYTYFERVGLDVEATREQLASERDRKLAEVRSVREQAEHQAKLAEESFSRVKRDYQRGAIEADDWAEQRPQLTEERDAALAEAERLRASEADVERSKPVADAEQETLERLAEIRKVIAGEVKDAESAAAVRAALSRLFERFVLHPAPTANQSRELSPDAPDRVPILDAGDYELEVWIREQALVNYDEPFSPVLRREPLSQAKNNYGLGLTM